ncbi:opacity protein-related protein, partial [Vibrio cholerae]|nr:opacity protein-related protein [Vibrio cholerae]EJL7007257.1 opacity protein-related protein [Vibrio cholerae]EKF9697583.1 opacity protein-related protein [Vibrio cholerae]
MKTVISLLATSILFASSVQAETTQETMSNNQFGISFKSSDFGNDFSKDTSSDLKDI